MKFIKSKKKLFLFLFIFSFILIVNTIKISSAIDYYSEDNYKSGQSIIINSQKYQIIVGNLGTQIKLTKNNFSDYISLGGCHLFNQSRVCFMENISDSEVKISINIKHGILKFDRKDIPSEIYVGKSFWVNYTFFNTGNDSLKIYFKENLEDYDFLESEEGYYNPETKEILFNKTIDEGTSEELNFKITPIISDSKLDLTPEIEYYNSYENVSEDIKSVTIDSQETFEYNFDIPEESFLFKKTNISLNIKNLMEIPFNYSIKIFKGNYSLLDSPMYIRTSKTEERDDLENETELNYNITLSPNRLGHQKIPIKIRFNNQKFDYEKDFFLEQNVKLKSKPKLILKFEEYIINQGNPILDIFLQNNEDYELQNIIININSSFLNTTLYCNNSYAISKIGEIELNSSGKKIISVKVIAHTKFGDPIEINTEKIIEFSEQKVNPNIKDISKKNNTIKNINENKISVSNSSNISSNENFSKNISEKTNITLTSKQNKSIEKISNNDLSFVEKLKNINIKILLIILIIIVALIIIIALNINLKLKLIKFEEKVVEKSIKKVEDEIYNEKNKEK